MFAFIGLSVQAFGQEPPLNPPGGSLVLGKPADAVAADGWLFYPTVRLFSLYSDNLFQSPIYPIAAFGLGLSPGLVAEWSNGIHKTTLYANAEGREYPNQNEINALDYQAGFVEQYEALRDLIFRVQGDYTHKTISPSLTSAIPGAVSSPTSTVLPNGNILLPNGTILSPSGQTVGSENPALVVNGTSVVNPYDQFTGTASVDKYFNRGIVSLSGSFARTNYQTPTPLQPNFTIGTFSGNGAFWLTPIFYAYSNGTFADSSIYSTTSFRAVGGLGFRLNRFFGGAAYFGRQGSQSSGTAGGDVFAAAGDVFGASLSYNPTTDLALRAAVDETINIASQPGIQTPLAQALPTPSPLLIPIGASTGITAFSWSANYTISPQWTASGTFGYTRVEYFGSIRLDNAWLADTMLIYSMRKNLTLNLEYQFAAIISNAALATTKSNYITIGALYKF
ncbi:MAG: hypothetical protein ACYC5H_11810 [Methylovirgula sp.]